MNTKTYRFFIKFGKKENIEALQKGTIYMNCLSFFRTLPEENLIGDKLEGIKSIRCLENVTLDLNIQKRDKITLKSIGSVHIYPTEKYEGNIFCMYGADENLLEKNLKGNRGRLQLGKSFSDSEYIAFINNPREFIRKIDEYFLQNGQKIEISPVNYIDFSNHKGTLSPFDKREIYRGQNEVRIFVKNNFQRPIMFNIGDISDICHIAPANKHNILEYRVNE